MSRIFAPDARDCTADVAFASFDNVNDLIRAYDLKYAGAYSDPQEAERFDDAITRAGGYVHASGAAHASGWAGSGAGRLTLPFVHVEACYPGSLPGPAQTRGDCVSHSSKNACLTTLCCEVVAARPDEETGKLEVAPEVSATAIQHGVLSTEAIYWWRGHGGDGWHCDHAARVCTTQSGMWLRRDYSEQFGFDLSRYSGSLAGKWGRSNPPGEVQAAGREHLIRTAARVSSFEELRDCLHNGYGVSSCGSEGFSNVRNEDGVSSRRGVWYHAMAYIGADDREETRRKYNGPLVLVLNSWGRGWNRGPQRIAGTGIDIPAGAFWARWSDVSRRTMFAFSGADGWPAQVLPPTFDPEVWG